MADVRKLIGRREAAIGSQIARRSNRDSNSQAGRRSPRHSERTAVKPTAARSGNARDSEFPAVHIGLGRECVPIRPFFPEALRNVRNPKRDAHHELQKVSKHGYLTHVRLVALARRKKCRRIHVEAVDSRPVLEQSGFVLSCSSWRRLTRGLCVDSAESCRSVIAQSIALPCST
jgi:hypothetical protein